MASGNSLKNQPLRAGLAARQQAPTQKPVPAALCKRIRKALFSEN